MRAADARVLLTGAGGGIGRAFVDALTTRGAAVLGVGRSAAGPGDAWLQADVTTPAGRAAIVSTAAAWQANVVVHAAGVPAFGAFRTLPAERLERLLRTNLLAPIELTRALLPQLERQPRAQIVFVGSVLGRIGLPGFAAYGASKAGIAGFAEALRRELADGPVRVQLLAPRTTRTGFNDAAARAYADATGAGEDSPQRVAAELLDLIEREAGERVLGVAERVFARLNGLLGSRLDGAFAKHRRSLASTPVTEGRS